MTLPLGLTAAGLIVTSMGGAMPTQARDASEPILTMRVLVLNPAGAPRDVLARAEEAASRVLIQAGIRTQWLPTGVSTVDTAQVTAFDLRDVIMVSLMSSVMETRLHAPATRLGFAVSGGRLANVMYSRVERLAGSRANVATVLGHVMAHEIGHLLLSPNAHASGGIMAATLDLQLAARGVLWFSAKEANRLRTRLAELAGPRATTPVAVALQDGLE